ncbi:hypothetical protein CVT26_014971 [Gymnopilus dilepis]|uniref:Uncharacterized protein n=1 Tax=Gymnopilus dilepis TaxID=231916 RepID=A0A409YXN9_9AGAR|nr:hypothetical protein CVT26_014971 [Gymnopilus dilepis]
MAKRARSSSSPNSKSNSSTPGTGYQPYKNPYPELDVLEPRSRTSKCTGRGILALRRYELRNAIIDSAYNGPGFPYSRKLEAHRSCVNALAFSSGDGRFLASGGDDLRICLWDFHQEDVKSPSFTFIGPRGNIFSIKFSAANRYLYAGGTCNTIFKYDISSVALNGHSVNRTPDFVYRDNNDSIRDLTCHPSNDELLISVSEDGTIRRYDGREPRRASAMGDVIQTTNELTGVQYHPILEHLFVGSNTIGDVVLRDSRMAFGSQTKRTGEGIVLRYKTRITKKSISHLSNPEASSVTFDRDGSRLAVTFLRYLPTIYALSDPDPLAVLSGKHLPDGSSNPPNERTYCNSCTMKHGSFGGPGLDVDDMYAAGSDDFRCYVWKVPSALELMEQRQTLTAESWLGYGDGSTIGFPSSPEGHVVVPAEISTPFCRLTGHNSIVNSALFHPHLLHVVTAGIEKKIILHSPRQSSPCSESLQLSPTTVRKLDDEASERDREIFWSALESAALQPAGITDDNDERQTLSLFDHIIRQEGDTDVFLSRCVGSEPFSSDEESDDSDSDEFVDDGGTFLMRPPGNFFTY